MTLLENANRIKSSKEKIKKSVNIDFNKISEEKLEDYSTKIDETIELYKQYIPTAKINGTNELTINDCAPINCKKFEIEGNSKQETTKGKNFFPLIPNQTIAGITSTQNEDGTITLNGKATERADLYCSGASAENYISIENIKPGEYALTGCPEGGGTSTYVLLCVIKNNSGTTKVYTDSGNGENNITINDGDTFRFFIRVIAGVTVENLIFKPMLRPVDTDNTFEKFTGGQASPNPDYPQETKSIAGIENLIDLNFTKYPIPKASSNYATDNDDETITLNGNINSLSNIYLLSDGSKTFCKLKANTTYTLLIDVLSGTMTGNSNIIIGSKDNPTYAYVSFGGKTKSYAFTIGSNAEDLMSLRMYTLNDTTFENLKLRFKLEEGTIAHSYVPYGHYLKIDNKSNDLEDVTYVNMQGNKLCSTEDLSIRDELDIVSGKGRKRIKEIILTGDEDWISASSVASDTSRFYFYVPDAYTGKVSVEDKKYAMSNAFKSLSWTDIYRNDTTTKNAISGYSSTDSTMGRIIIRIDNNYASNVEELKQLLKEKYDKGTPVKVQYVLAEPEEFYIEPTEIKMFEGTNIFKIESNLDTDFSIEYYKKPTVTNEIEGSEI